MTIVIAAAAMVGVCSCSAGRSGGNGGSGGGGGVAAGADLATGDAAGGDLGTAADLASGDLAGGGLLYDVDGPEPYTQVQLTATGSGKSIALVAFVPATAGARPAVVLASGLQQPAAAYAPYGRRLASWGIVAVLRDDPGVLAQTQSVADDLAFVLGWLPAASDAAIAGRVDAARLGLAGHSRGGMAALLAIEGGAKVAGFFGIDPVDNAGTAAKGLGAIAVPTVFLGETTDASGAMACAPADQNYDVLWKAAPAPSLELTMVGADHTQFEDPASCALCTLCTAGSADGAEVRRESLRYVAAFFARTLLADARVDATIESAVDVAAGRVIAQAK